MNFKVFSLSILTVATLAACNSNDSNNNQGPSVPQIMIQQNWIGDDQQAKLKIDPKTFDPKQIKTVIFNINQNEHTMVGSDEWATIPATPEGTYPVTATITDTAGANYAAEPTNLSIQNRLTGVYANQDGTQFALLDNNTKHMSAESMINVLALNIDAQTEANSKLFYINNLTTALADKAVTGTSVSNLAIADAKPTVEATLKYSVQKTADALVITTGEGNTQKTMTLAAVKQHSLPLAELVNAYTNNGGHNFDLKADGTFSFTKDACTFTGQFHNGGAYYYTNKVTVDAACANEELKKVTDGRLFTVTATTPAETTLVTAFGTPKNINTFTYFPVTK